MTITQQPKVVLADDEPHVRVLLKTLLASMKCEVVGEASNGEEAVKLFKKERPDLVLLDINMPVKSGIEALKDILHEFPDAFVIMLTSVSDTDSIRQCMELGAANYIRKDNPVVEIKRLIKETWQDRLKNRKES